MEFLQMKKALRRDEVSLTFCGISFESGNQFRYWDHGPYRLFRDLLPKFYLQDYSRLCEPELRWTKRIDYAELELPNDLHEKFKHVKEVEIKLRMNDEDRLLGFIGGFKRLNSLRIGKEAQLGSSFYGKLAGTCSLIPHLAIWMEQVRRAHRF